MENVRISDLGVALLDMVMPRLCVVCRQELQLRERHICTCCLADLPQTWFWIMPRNPMADKFNACIQRDLQEAPGDMRHEPYSYAAALFYYNSESGYRRIPQHLKYRSGIASGRRFSARLGRHLAASPLFADVDLVLPVPLHWTRLYRRGYNQATVIAKVLAEELGVECRTDLLRRHRRTRTQTRMGMEAKSANVKGAFSLRRGAFPKLPKHVLLVDDTFTTGATLNACRKALREALPEQVRISVATLAYVSS